MKENNKTHCKSSSYGMENMESPEITEETGGVWDKTKEGVAKAWSVTKEGAVKAWDKTKEVTEDITGFGNRDKDGNAYFEEENFTDENGDYIHHSHGYTENSKDFASFNETDESEVLHDNLHHTHTSSSAHRPSSHS